MSLNVERYKERILDLRRRGPVGQTVAGWLEELIIDIESLTAERADLQARVAELEPDAAILKRIDAFTNLEPGWDGYRGAPLSARTAEKAKEIFRGLPPLNWQVVPGGDGSVQFEYHGQEWDIEVSIIDAAREVKS